MQKLKKCKPVTTAKLDIEVNGAIQCISVFSPIIELICQGEPTKIALVSSPEFDVVINKNNIAVSVHRQ